MYSTIKDIPFTDLYLGMDMHTRLMKGNGVGRGVRPVPEEYHEDCTVLLSTTISLEQEKKRPEFSVSHDGLMYRVAKIPSVGGVLFHYRRAQIEPKSLQSLNIDPINIAKMKDLGKSHNGGLSLVIGGYGEGKSTTAATMFKEWMIENGGVGVALESPVEFPLAGTHGDALCLQIEVPEDEVGRAIEDQKRWAPNYMFLGEIRKAESANQLISAANSNLNCVATLHGGDISQGVTSLVRFANRDQQEEVAKNIANCISAFIHIRLVDRVDPKSGVAIKVPEIRALYVTDENRAQVRVALEKGNYQQLDEMAKVQRQSLQKTQPVQHMQPRQAAMASMAAPAARIGG